MADLKNTFSKGLTVLNVKTSNFLEVNKIKTYVTNLNNDIAILKSDIGDIVYGQWETGEIHIDGFTDRLKAIDEKRAIIRQQEAELEEITLKEKQILGGQNASPCSVAEPSQVTPMAPLPQTGQAINIICLNCGTAYNYDLNFCRKCGTKLK